MKNFNPLIVCLACSITLPAMAAESTGEYSSLRPKTEMEGAPEALSGPKLQEKTLTVENVDMANRLITLQGPEGKMVTVMADARVKNLAQVKKGDKVHVGYYEAMAVELVTPGAATSQPAVKTASVSAEKGAKPAGGVARHTSTTVQILSVDPYKKAISFRDADGRWREVSMAKPELQHYLTDLKEGDQVQVTYTEALAVSVEPR